jgi:hypothetical protein
MESMTAYYFPTHNLRQDVEDVKFPAVKHRGGGYL